MVRIVTENFMNPRIIENDDEYIEFVTPIKESKKSSNVEDHIVYINDKRTGIYCLSPTLDLNMYLNYLKCLNSLKDRWTSYGYFDCGLVPYIWFPKFMDEDAYAEQLMIVPRTFNIPIVETKHAVTVMGSKSGLAFGKDVWMKRSSMFELSKILDEKLGTHINFASEKDVCMSGLLERGLIPIANAGGTV